MAAMKTQAVPRLSRGFLAIIWATTKLKKEVIATDNIEVSAKSRLRITIESLLIDLNEEIFALSEELAKSFSQEASRNLVSKAREFEHRKK